MFEQAFKNIDDVLWKDAGCTSELDYTEQTSWLLFLKYLDALEHDKATEAALDGRKYTPILVLHGRRSLVKLPTLTPSNGPFSNSSCNTRSPEEWRNWNRAS